MKTATALFTGFLVLASTAIADVYPGPALYYSFDTDAGATVPDDSGNGNSGQVLGAVWVTNGVRGGAYSFHMTNYISAGNKFDVGTVNSQITVCAWIKAPARFSVWNTIIGKQQAPDPYCGWRVTADPRNCACAQVIATHPQMAVVDGTSLIRGDDQWHFICAVFESAPNLLATHLYVDGAWQVSDVGSLPHGPTETDDPLLIGYRMSGNEGIDGLIDEVRVFTRRLSDAEIAALADPNTVTPTNSPGGSGHTASNSVALYYSFDTNTGTTVVDQSGHGNHGSVHGAQYVADGVSGGAYRFNGTNWIEAGDIFDMVGSVSQLTVSVWAKADGCLWDGYQPVLIAKQQEAYPYRGWILMQNFYNNGLSQVIATWPQMATGSGTTIFGGDQRWHFLCSTYEVYPNLMRCRLYVDGVLEGSETWTGAHDTTEAATPLTLGARQPNGIAHWGFKGLLDEVRVDARLLSDAEIAGLYARTKPAEPEPAAAMTIIGFSNSPTGEQDVAVFTNDETLHIRVRDADLVSTERFSNLRAILTQIRGGRPMRVTALLNREPDGSFAGSFPLSSFKPGGVRVWLGCQSARGDYLVRQSDITILPPVSTARRPSVAPGRNTR